MDSLFEKKYRKRCVCGHQFPALRGGGEYRWHRGGCLAWLEFKRDWSTLCACGCGRTTRFLKEYLNGHQPHPSGVHHPSFGRPVTVETKMKLSRANKGRPAWNHGLPHSEKTRSLISNALAGKKRSLYSRRQQSIRMRGYTVPFNEEIRAILSLKAKARIARDGHPMQGRRHRPESIHKMSAKAAAKLRVNGGFASGSFWSSKNQRWIIYRSSYEKFFYQFLEAAAVVETYEVEPDTIEYRFQGRSRHYVPDVVVQYIFGLKQAIEIKPWALLRDPEVRAKSLAATRFYMEKGIVFSMVTEREFERLSVTS